MNFKDFAVSRSSKSLPMGAVSDNALSSGEALMQLPHVGSGPVKCRLLATLANPSATSFPLISEWIGIHLNVML